jgi:2-methylcitrate dehydratase PrpD
MTEPEKIFMTIDGYIVDRQIEGTDLVSRAEYTRSDLIPAMLAEARAEGRREALREAAEIAFEADDCYLARNAILALLDAPDA